MKLGELRNLLNEYIECGLSDVDVEINVSEDIYTIEAVTVYARRLSEERVVYLMHYHI